MSPEIERLVFKAYHGELCPVERKVLSQWVAASPVHARHVLEHSADANAIAIASRNDRLIQPCADPSKPLNLEPQTSLWDSKFITFKQAALIVVVSLVAAVLWLGLRHQILGSGEHVELAATAPARSLEGDDKMPVDWQVMESTDLEWNHYTSTQFSKDSKVIVIPASGFVYHEFDGGGFVLLQGPARYQLEGAYAIRLIKGRLVAKADSLEPFTIVVDSTKITGEGAEFGVQNVDDNVASAVAFEGTLKVAPQNPSNADSVATSVTAGQRVALQSNGEAGRLTPATESDTAEYERLIDSVKLRPSYMASTIQFLAEAPPSVQAGDLVNDRYCRLFCERTGVSVSAGELPAIPKRPMDLEEVPTDVLLDSYVLHFDPQLGNNAMSTGKITFDRPIRAVLGSALSIQSTDAFFGSVNTTYPRTDRPDSRQDTHRWGIEFGKDCIRLGDDPKTLYFRFYSDQELDQIRILVEARKPSLLFD